MFGGTEIGSMKVVLELQDQPSNVRRITVRHDIVIGRGSDCNLRLSAPQVSRRHCFLRVGRDSVSVTDLDSSNGTFVDGKQIVSGKRHDLVDGTELALGPIQFLIHVQAEVVTPEDSASSAVGMLANSAMQSEVRHSSKPARPVNSDGSTHTSGSGSGSPDLPMNYSLEHGGAAAEENENTSDCLNSRLRADLDQEKFSTESPLNDSRLEIIDFGRHLAQQTGSDAVAEANDDPAVESVLSGKSTLWESMTEGSSDDLDVLSMPEEILGGSDDSSSDIDCLPDAKDYTDAEPETVDIEESAEVEVIEVIDAEVPEEILESSGEVLLDAVVVLDDDDIDNELREFLKGN